MKHEQAEGIILRTRPLTETSLIVHWLTPQFGRIATVAKGARRPKSPFRGKLDLFFLAEFSFARSRRSDLHILREAVLRETHDALRRDIARLQQAAYAAALIEQTSETETPLPAEFDLFDRFLREVTAAEANPASVLAFEFKLLAQLGQAPELDTTSLTEGSRRIAQRLTSRSWDELRTLKLTADQAREMKQFLHGFMTYHLGKIPKGRGAALAHN